MDRFSVALRQLTNKIITMTSSMGIKANGAVTGVNSNGRKHVKVCIEGNIASGKTTLLEYFRSFPQTQVIEEPVKRWRNCDGHNPLGMMYEDPKRWSLAFQTYVQLTMLDIHSLEQTAPVKMMERSIYSARYCFVENLHKTGLMAPVEYSILSQWFDWIIKTQAVDLDLIVYLRTQPEICYERIRRRNRMEEKEIPLDYLKTLHNLHEDWLIEQKPFKCPAPVVVLNANHSIEKMQAIFKEEKHRILGDVV